MTIKIHLRAEPENKINLKSDIVNILNNQIVGSDDYNLLQNKPHISGIELIGDKSLGELGITPDGIGVSRITNMELEELLT